jgi:hypothetical protein
MPTEKPSKCYSFAQLAIVIFIALLLGSGLSLSLAPYIADYAVDHMSLPSATANER